VVIGVKVVARVVKQWHVDSNSTIELFKLCVLAQLGIKGWVAEGKKPFDGERPRVSSRFKRFFYL
jgi:hypothetical protein